MLWLSLPFLTCTSFMSICLATLCIQLCRCETASGLPRLCNQFYDDGYYNETLRNGLRMLIDDLGMEFAASNDNEPFVNLVLNYLCYYYFPVCNLTTGVVSYTCISSCGLLVNNAVCSSLLSQPAL